jgi:hypothetical protein
MEEPHLSAANTAWHTLSSNCTCRAHPLPAAMRVRDARDAYLAENGFSATAYDAAKSEGSLFGIRVAVPNPLAHRRALRLHDLHHVATGFGTDHAGEAELSAWQLRRGLLRAGLYVGAIVATNVLVGLAVAPRRTLGALRNSAGSSLFSTAADYDALLEMTVGELRRMLGVAENGLTSRQRGLHAHAPSC